MEGKCSLTKVAPKQVCHTREDTDGEFKNIFEEDQSCPEWTELQMKSVQSRTHLFSWGQPTRFTELKGQEVVRMMKWTYLMNPLHLSLDHREEEIMVDSASKFPKRVFSLLQSQQGTDFLWATCTQHLGRHYLHAGLILSSIGAVHLAQPPGLS